MNNTVKFLIGAGVTAVGVATMVYYSKKVKERKRLVFSGLCRKPIKSLTQDLCPS